MQEIKVTAVIKDSLQALPNANILAIPLVEGLRMLFTFNKMKGKNTLFQFIF